MRVAAVVVKQRTIPRNYHERYRWGESEYVSGTRAAAWVTSHDSKHTKKNRERGRNRVGGLILSVPTVSAIRLLQVTAGGR